MIEYKMMEKEVAAASMWKIYVQRIMDRVGEEEQWNTHGMKVVCEDESDEEYEENELQVEELLRRRPKWKMATMKNEQENE